MLPTGGSALAQAIFRDYHPTQPLPSAGELHGAIDDLSADGLIHPQLADYLHAGGNAPGRHLAANIADRVATGRGLPSILDPQAGALSEAHQQFVQAAIPTQATAEVSSLMGGSSMLPNGGPRGPILNATRYQGAIDNYQRHASDMVAQAPSLPEKAALSEIAANAPTARKQAILASYLQANPGADTTRFTPTLMTGTN